MTAGAPLYNLAIMSAKTAVLSFYLRFPSSRAFKACTFMTMAFTVGNALSAVLAGAYLCRPAAKMWDAMLEGTCLDWEAAFLVTAVLNMATDVVILLLPIWLLAPLRLPFWRKVGVTCILMAGGL
jgi:hypothetical protein